MFTFKEIRNFLAGNQVAGIVENIFDYSIQKINISDIVSRNNVAQDDRRINILNNFVCCIARIGCGPENGKPSPSKEFIKLLLDSVGCIRVVLPPEKKCF